MESAVHMCLGCCLLKFATYSSQLVARWELHYTCTQTHSDEWFCNGIFAINILLKSQTVIRASSPVSQLADSSTQNRMLLGTVTCQIQPSMTAYVAMSKPCWPACIMLPPYA